MTKRQKYTGAYIIAFHFCSDVRDVTENRYQPTRYVSPAIYTLGDDYYCCPAAGKDPPRNRDFTDAWEWEPIGEHYGRTVYRSRV